MRMSQSNASHAPPPPELVEGERRVLVLEIDGQRVERAVTVRRGATEADMNAALADAFPGLPPERRPSVRLLSPEELASEKARSAKARRESLLSLIRSYPPEEVARALADARRKGWGLDGLSLDKLETVALYLGELSEDADEDARQDERESRTLEREFLDGETAGEHDG